MIATLTADEVGSVPAPARLIDLNSRRNTSVHGHWTEVLDREALEDAIAAGRQFHRAAAVYIKRRGVALKQGEWKGQERTHGDGLGQRERSALGACEAA